ncbi:mutator-like element transposase [Fusarium albosuccineum]|uniref:Mutator-like element transposase n=1 Tax=Fusarium albosuccineum TaxID=1237068 RepID=A0A8H4L8M1_9HYPO|nr:mutator-like element transposase [Fusarium albosuccineum]
MAQMAYPADVLPPESIYDTHGTTWVLSHRPGGEYALHNHPPSEDLSAHPAHRQLKEDDLKIISSLTASGTAPREIRTYLYDNSDTLATQKDIYDRIAATRRDLREGQSSIQALVDQLNREGFWCRVRLDPDNRLTAIFFAHPESIAYLQCNPNVLILDCTYKTNKHAMPLLDMVGVDSCQRSFCIAFAFLSGETEEDYSWALQHLKSLYQHDYPSVILTDRWIAAMNAAANLFPFSKALLCLWHVNKAVLQHCRPVITLSGGDQADKAWDEFFACWHSIVASPTEAVFQQRLASFEDKYAEKYTEAVGYIKTFWLEPYKERIVKAWVDKHLHFGNIAASRQKLEEERKALLLEHFYPHWHLKRDATQPRPMLEPRAAPSQYKEKRNQPITSTRQEPSAFEKVEAAAQPRAKPKCSRCHTLGHKMTSKTCPLRYEEGLQPSAAPSPESSRQEGPSKDSTNCIVVSVADMGGMAAAASPAAPLTQAGTGPTLRYDDPRAIYQRYVAARDTWYKAQAHGIVKTNEEYRKALGLPLRYDKASYQWCLDWKQMGKRCTMPTGSRDWTKEEMMAYLDWNKAEDDRVEAQVAADMESNPFSAGRRGMGRIWEAAERDSKEQQGLYSAE